MEENPFQDFIADIVAVLVQPVRQFLSSQIPNPTAPLIAEATSAVTETELIHGIKKRILRWLRWASEQVIRQPRRVRLWRWKASLKTEKIMIMISELDTKNTFLLQRRNRNKQCLII